MYVSQQLTILFYDIISLVLTVCFASLFLIIESSRNSYHSQKLSDLPKIELAWKLIRGVGRKQISKMSWFLLAAYVMALLLNSFLTTILNSRTEYTTEFIVGNAASYYVDPTSLNQTMDIGQQCADVSGEIMPVECLYANLAGIYYLNANNVSNSVGLIGSQYEQMSGEYAYSSTAPNIGGLGGGTTPGVSTTAGTIVLSGIAQFIGLATDSTGSAATVSIIDQNQFVYNGNGSTPLFPGLNTATSMTCSASTLADDPFSILVVQSIAKVGFYSSIPDMYTYQNSTYQTLEYYYGNYTDVTMVLTTAHTFTGPVTNPNLPTFSNINAFSGMITGLTPSNYNQFVQDAMYCTTTSQYAVVVQIDTTNNNSACYEMLYYGGVGTSGMGIVHTKNCWTALSSNMTLQRNVTGGPSYMAMRPVANTRYGSLVLLPSQNYTMYGAGPGPQYYDYTSKSVQNVLLNLAAQGNTTHLAIPIIQGHSVTGNYNGGSVVAALIVIILITALCWAFGKWRAGHYSMPLIDALLNNGAKGGNYENILGLNNLFLTIDGEQVTTTFEMYKSDATK